MTQNIKNALNKIHFESARVANGISSNFYEEDLSDALKTHISGDHDGAIGIVKSIQDWHENPLAQRIYGHALHGEGVYEAACAAHMKARSLNEANLEERANDEINLAAVQISMKDYTAAMESYDRAERLAGNRVEIDVGRICILNREERHQELSSFMKKLLEKDPDFFSNSLVIKHLADDSDFTGVGGLLKNIKEKKMFKSIVPVVALLFCMASYASPTSTSNPYGHSQIAASNAPIIYKEDA